MYKISKNILEVVNGVFHLSDNTFIPFDPANTDYQQFKTDIAGGAELQDADGNLMTAEEADAFIATLPGYISFVIINE